MAQAASAPCVGDRGPLCQFPRAGRVGGTGEGSVLLSWGLGSAGLAPRGAQPGAGLLETGEWSGHMRPSSECQVGHQPGWGVCSSSAPLVSAFVSGQSCACAVGRGQGRSATACGSLAAVPQPRDSAPHSLVKATLQPWSGGDCTGVCLSKLIEQVTPEMPTFFGV